MGRIALTNLSANAGFHKGAQMKQLTSASFVLDTQPKQHFKGYTGDSDWNGFTCPYFEREEAERVLSASEPNGYRWTYDADQDAFLVRSEDDPEDYEPEVFAGTEQQTINGDTLTVYAIGAYSWAWLPVEKTE
jgi:deoxyribodipyrimidine photolyase-like uncharacterized protein